MTSRQGFSSFVDPDIPESIKQPTWVEGTRTLEEEVVDGQERLIRANKSASRLQKGGGRKVRRRRRAIIGRKTKKSKRKRRIKPKRLGGRKAKPRFPTGKKKKRRA